MKVFIGYDSRENIAYEVCRYSLESRNNNVDITSLNINNLRKSGLYYRTTDKYASTEFTFTRFLVPYLMNYDGWALFCDCDIIFLQDIKKLFDVADDKYAVMCVHHDYKPTSTTKMDNQIQTIYPRKNWSSVVLWNCAHPSNKILSVEKINDHKFDGAYFHRFSWLSNNEIGELDPRWNWLAGWNSKTDNREPFTIHYTEGGPWFDDHKNCEYADKWDNELMNMMTSHVNPKL